MQCKQIVQGVVLESEPVIMLTVWLQIVFDAQMASLKSFSMPGGGSAENVRVQTVTQRYAALEASLLLLNADFQARTPFQP